LLFEGVDIANADPVVRKTYRRSVQAVFQDPQSSLNPRMRIGDIVAEPVEVSLRLSRAETRARVLETLDKVGIGADMAERFPHQFSGGQRQRIAIARALAVRAKAIVLDEPVASLDVSVRSQVLNLLRDLQDEYGLSYLFISHDLATSAYLCHRVAVMYLGRIVETGSAAQLYRDPKHPYTQALLAAAEITPMAAGAQELDTADVPSPIAPPPGCHFHPRCPRATERCKVEAPASRVIAEGRVVACHLYE
jgi:oligopeptide transport system ATP-binding protein